MESYQDFPSVTFVVLTVDQFVAQYDGPREQQKQDSRVCPSSDFEEKVRVVTTKTAKSEKLKIRNGFLNM